MCSRWTTVRLPLCQSQSVYIFRQRMLFVWMFVSNPHLFLSSLFLPHTQELDWGQMTLFNAEVFLYILLELRKPDWIGYLILIALTQSLYSDNKTQRPQRRPFCPGGQLLRWRSRSKLRRKKWTDVRGRWQCMQNRRQRKKNLMYEKEQL